MREDEPEPRPGRRRPAAQSPLRSPARRGRRHGRLAAASGPRAKSRRAPDGPGAPAAGGVRAARRPAGCRDARPGIRGEPARDRRPLRPDPRQWGRAGRCRGHPPDPGPRPRTGPDRFPDPARGHGSAARDAAKAPGTSDFPPGEAEPSYVLSRGRGLLLDRPWSWGLAVLLAAMPLLLVAYVLTRWFAPPRTPGGRRRARPAPPSPRKSSSEGEPTIVVVTADGEEKPAPDLSEAMNAAIGSGGSVVLRNRDPLHIVRGQAADLPAHRGMVDDQGRRGDSTPCDRRHRGVPIRS